MLLNFSDQTRTGALNIFLNCKCANEFLKIRSLKMPWFEGRCLNGETCKNTYTLRERDIDVHMIGLVITQTLVIIFRKSIGLETTQQLPARSVIFRVYFVSCHFFLVKDINFFVPVRFTIGFEITQTRLLCCEHRSQINGYPSPSSQHTLG